MSMNLLMKRGCLLSVAARAATDGPATERLNPPVGVQYPCALHKDDSIPKCRTKQLRKAMMFE